MHREVKAVLAGNPNCGKTALFNALTGSNQRVGNWAGVTVDKKTGNFEYENSKISVVDLPGVYSLSVASEVAIDEKIAYEYLLSEEADVVVNVLDGSNLVRNLYLTLQLLEMNLPVILAVNMMDMVRANGLELDLKQLEKFLGCRVVALVASENTGVDLLKETIVAVAKKPKKSAFKLEQLSVLQQKIDFLSLIIKNNISVSDEKSAWLALRLLEGDYYALKQVDNNIAHQAREQIQQIENETGEEPDILIADARYRTANNITDKITTLRKTVRQSVTSIIDRVVLNRFAGIPIFLFVMYLMFFFSTNVGGALQDFFDQLSATIFIQGFTHVLQQWNLPHWLIAVLAGGFGTGINTVVTFAPILGAMFLFLSFLEDCGYMARAAFVMDRFMQALGLPGKSFVPMIVGFGCNVPAVLGARTLANPRDRILTIMMMPFMSCGARLAIFSVFASAFFPHSGAYIIFMLYLIGIVVAVLSGFVLRRTVLKGEPAPLVMELPAYHMPKIKTLLRHAWQRLTGFLLRAGQYIVPICIVIGVLNTVSITGHLVPQGDKRSLLAKAGHVITPVFTPMGITEDNWPATVGLATGILAKEVVVGTLNSLYSDAAVSTYFDEQFDFWLSIKTASLSVPHNLVGLPAALKQPISASEPPHEMSNKAYGVMYERFHSTAGAFSYLLFVLLYFPCISTMAAMRREINNRWAYFSVFWSVELAYTLAVIYFQMATVVLHPFSSLLWSSAMLFVLIFTVWILRFYARKGDILPNINSVGEFNAA